MDAASIFAGQTTSRMLLRHLPLAGCQGHAFNLGTMSMCSEAYDDACTSTTLTRDEQFRKDTVQEGVEA